MIRIAGLTDVERIGRGGLGDVYRATRASTGVAVAVKVLRDVSDESVAWHRTRRELTALVSLAGHAHVVQLLELLELPEGPALVMEHAPGGSIAELLERRGGTLSVAEAVLVGRHTAAALVAAHAEGIVHRDLKPQNLLIDAYGQVRLCDFGIAALTRSEEFRTRTSALSMRYASPEDLDDEATVGPPSDVYSLGATLLHVARGAPPTLKERLAPWEPPTTDDPELATLDRVLASCLHPSPVERPTAAELLDVLEQLDWSLADRRRRLEVDGVATTAGSPATGASPPTPPSPAVDAVDQPCGTADREQGASSATTVLRPGRRPPTRPPAPPTRGGRRRVWPVVAAVAAIIAVMGATVWWRTGGGDTESATRPARTTVAPSTAPDRPANPEPAGSPATGAIALPATVELVARPPGLTPVDDPAVVWPAGDDGQCLVQLADRSELAPVDCAEPHDLQRIGSGLLPASVSVYDVDVVRDAVRVACREIHRDIVGEEVTGLDIPFTAPSATTWDDGDRGYQCFVGLAGRRLTGDLVAG